LKTLDTGIKNSRNVKNYIFGAGTLDMLESLVSGKRRDSGAPLVFFIDEYFRNDKKFIDGLPVDTRDLVIYIPTRDEPTTEQVDEITESIKDRTGDAIAAVVAIGGGITMDVGKAVANMLTNTGKAEDYQGWDLVKNPAIYKIAIPTISGTGAEATRTCVMTNKKTGLKLGMNSDFTVYDQIILDPDLTRTVPDDQYFWTGMDAYIHCMESLGGYYRNAIGDAFSRESLRLSREVFNSDMKDDTAREQLMVASYLGGCAIATSYVGVVHPLSAALSVVLGTHHCVANCIVMRAMEEFYPEGYAEFWQMVDKQKVSIPKGICRSLNDEKFTQLHASSIIHEKPLTNALGENFREILTPAKTRELFFSM
jgi:3-deoxy-alpha-D-manno-octulosonate 8-oxidase